MINNEVLVSNKVAVNRAEANKVKVRADNVLTHNSVLTSSTDNNAEGHTLQEFKKKNLLRRKFRIRFALPLPS
jgi:hypothetical protein